MLTTDLTKAIHSPLIINHQRDGFMKGYIMNEGGKKEFFVISWDANCAHLKIKKNNEIILNAFTQKFGKPQLRSECKGSFGLDILYSWIREEKEVKIFQHAFSLAMATNTDIFRFSNWPKVDRVN